VQVLLLSYTPKSIFLNFKHSTQCPTIAVAENVSQTPFMESIYKSALLRSVYPPPESSFQIDKLWTSGRFLRGR